MCRFSLRSIEKFQQHIISIFLDHPTEPLKDLDYAHYRERMKKFSHAISSLLILNHIETFSHSRISLFSHWSWCGVGKTKGEKNFPFIVRCSAIFYQFYRGHGRIQLCSKNALGRIIFISASFLFWVSIILKKWRDTFGSFNF